VPATSINYRINNTTLDTLPSVDQNGHFAARLDRECTRLACDPKRRTVVMIGTFKGDSIAGAITWTSVWDTRWLSGTFVAKRRP
jgi:hypothetical protein